MSKTDTKTSEEKQRDFKQIQEEATATMQRWGAAAPL